MLWVKAFHIIFIVTWFSGLFYLPRLFVYHAMSDDAVSNARFKIMERKLYYAISMPSAILASVLGAWLLFSKHAYYSHLMWMHAKLILVMLLWVYHLACGYYVYLFKHDRNQHSHIFYRWFNEIPSILLIAIIILVVVQP